MMALRGVPQFVAHDREKCVLGSVGFEREIAGGFERLIGLHEFGGALGDAPFELDRSSARLACCACLRSVTSRKIAVYTSRSPRITSLTDISAGKPEPFLRRAMTSRVVPFTRLMLIRLDSAP